MKGTPNWVEAWNARAASRRNVIELMLSYQANNPAASSIRDLYINRLQNLVAGQKAWAEAYINHVKALQAILGSRAGVTGSAEPEGSKGEL